MPGMPMLIPGDHSRHYFCSCSNSYFLMNHDVFTPEYPVLEGPTIRLRSAKASDVQPLYFLLQEPLVLKEYWAGPTAPTLQQVHVGYMFHSLLNYSEKKAITWVIENIDTGEVIGLRDLFVDNDFKPLTIQGFVGIAHRKKGFSSEAYRLILDFARTHDVVGLRANTSAENFAAMALLFSAGFSTEYSTLDNSGDLRFVLGHDLSSFIPPVFDNAETKRIYIFCRMYLQGEDISIARNGYLRRDGQIQSAFRVSTYAKNTIGDSLLDIYYETISFDSDGTVFMSLDESDVAAFIDGRMPLTDTWDYCWSECVTDN